MARGAHELIEFRARRGHGLWKVNGYRGRIFGWKVARLQRENIGRQRFRFFPRKAHVGHQGFGANLLGFEKMFLEPVGDVAGLIATEMGKVEFVACLVADESNVGSKGPAASVENVAPQTPFRFEEPLAMRHDCRPSRRRFTRVFGFRESELDCISE